MELDFPFKKCYIPSWESWVTIKLAAVKQVVAPCERLHNSVDLPLRGAGKFGDFLILRIGEGAQQQ